MGGAVQWVSVFPPSLAPAAAAVRGLQNLTGGSSQRACLLLHDRALLSTAGQGWSELWALCGEGEREGGGRERDGGREREEGRQGGRRL